jgi:hypothetical protein
VRFVRQIVPVTVVMSLALLGGRAEASRIAFNGAGNQGAIIWDESGDVSTMATDCGGSSVCSTTLYGLLPAGFGFLVTPEDPAVLADLAIQSIHMLLSVSALPGDPCVGDVQCGTLSNFGGLSDSGWAERDPNDPKNDPNIDPGDRVTTSTQALIRLAMVTVLDQPGFYALTQESVDFLATLDSAVLAAAHVGVDVTRSSTGFPLTPFVVETATPSSTAPVPEPGTLLLLGSGAVIMARRWKLRVR